MDAATVQARLIAEGISCRCRRDGVLVASLMKPRSESWVLWLRDRIRQFPGAEVIAKIERPAGDPYFAHTEIRFTLGTRPESIHSITAQLLDTEGNADEVGIGDGAVIPAHFVYSLGMRPGSVEGPGRVSPGVVVGPFGPERAA